MYMKMTNSWSFSYNSFVKLSLYNTAHLESIPMDSKHSIIKGLHHNSFKHALCETNEL